MKEDESSPLEAVTDEATEARIVAWVLGEASGFEAAELERLCVERPELEIFHRRMLALNGLLAEVETVGADAEWKLPAAKMSGLDDFFDQRAALDDPAVVLIPRRFRWRKLQVMSGIAAISPMV